MYHDQMQFISIKIKCKNAPKGTNTVENTMSYTPEIMFCHEDVIEHIDAIENIQYNGTEYEDTAKLIFDELKTEPLKFKGLQFHIVQPEFSNFNLLTRKLLDKFNIEYLEYN